MGELRRALRPGQLGVARQAAQAAIAGHVAREQHEMRAQLARADAAHVLAPRLAMTRRPQPIDARAGPRDRRPAGSDWTRFGRLRARFRLRRGMTIAVRVRRDGVEQLDLHARRSR